jgi:hypothetical protein
MESRRTIIGGLGALAAGAVLAPRQGQAKPAVRRPARLRPGEHGRAGRARRVQRGCLRGPARHRDGGGDGPQAQARPARPRHGTAILPAPDRERAADLNAMFRDPSVKAIFAIRGRLGFCAHPPASRLAVQRVLWRCSPCPKCSGTIRALGVPAFQVRCSVTAGPVQPARGHARGDRRHARNHPDPGARGRLNGGRPSVRAGAPGWDRNRCGTRRSARRHARPR